MNNQRTIEFYQAEDIQALIDLLEKIKKDSTTREGATPENSGEKTIMRKFNIIIKLPDKYLEVLGERTTEDTIA